MWSWSVSNYYVVIELAGEGCGGSAAKAVENHNARKRSDFSRFRTSFDNNRNGKSDGYRIANGAFVANMTKNAAGIIAAGMAVNQRRDAGDCQDRHNQHEAETLPRCVH